MRRFKKRDFKKRVERKFERNKTVNSDKKKIIGEVIKFPHGYGVASSDKRDKNKYILKDNGEKIVAGELIEATTTGRRVNGKSEAVISKCLGRADDARNISIIAISEHDIRDEFDDEALREAEKAKPVSLHGRADLRDLPLVTIDGKDARDFDDAVYAEKEGKGWHVIVAIADVANYVKSGSALDKEAYKRGNSTYFPDRVVPMLPEALSNDPCSLKPNVDRACMAAHLWIDADGELTRWKFERGVMKSKARLTYEQAQKAIDGHPDAATSHLLDNVIKPLYGTYECLMRARLKRGTLELDLPERKVNIAADGTVKSIKVRERLESHKLIEELMIAANVAAAAQLEGKGGICLYRIHDKPSEIKLDALREFLDGIGISLVPAKQLHPRMLTNILAKTANSPQSEIVNEVMLRSQSQAVYSPENIGHFGLALAKYAHFTSPIRRYADLMVHRALIRACKLGEDGITDEQAAKLALIGEHISETERSSAAAEREAVDRFTALFLSDKVGKIFSARISGVARFGLFARLDDTGADGIIPFNSLPRDYYEYDQSKQTIVGQRKGRSYRLADRVNVRLDSADRLTGGMSFSIIER